MRSTLLALTAACVTAIPAHWHDDRCEDVKFSITVTSNSYIFKNTIDPNNATQIEEVVQDYFAEKTDYSPISNKTITTTVDIAGIYCDPKHTRYIQTSPETLQLLVHGASLNTTYFSGQGQGDQYSYIRAALLQGHSILSIDRLGHGLSSHPNPVTIVQTSIQVEILQQLITFLKTPPTTTMSTTVAAQNPLSLHRPINKIIYIGHSYGSIIGTNLLTRYPSAVDAIILTGFSLSLTVPLPSILNNWITVTESPGPDPINQHIPAGFLRPRNGTLLTQSFFAAAGSYDPRVADFTFTHSDVQSIGEFLSQGPATAAPGFAGEVLVVTGGGDVLFCPESEGGCEAQLEKVGGLFEGASSFGVYVAEGSGHCLFLDYGAQTTFAKIGEWVEGLGW